VTKPLPKLDDTRGDDVDGALAPGDRRGWRSGLHPSGVVIPSIIGLNTDTISTLSPKSGDIRIAVMSSKNLLLDFAGEEFALSPDDDLTFARGAELDIDDNPVLPSLR